MDFLKFFIFINIICIFKAEPIILGLAGTLVFGIGSYVFNQRYINCYFNECCAPDSKWLSMNMTKLEEDINNQLHGQHLVKLVLLRHLKSHLFNNNPSKALLLSFNGMSGTGKNFVSTIIANSMFKNGMKSKYVHLFVSSVHFPLESEVENYKVKLQKTILESVQKCPRTVFIFDEVQDMPGNLLDAIKPFVDHYESIDGVDFRKAIFILLGNSGGRDINTKVMEAHSSGKSRESITLKEIEEVLSKNLFEMKNDGLRRSKLISHHLITAYVPFLPLERTHVELCIKNLFKERMLPENPEKVSEIIENLKFVKLGNLEVASHGCKRISEKFDLIMH